MTPRDLRYVHARTKALRNDRRLLIIAPAPPPLTRDDLDPLGPPTFRTWPIPIRTMLMRGLNTTIRRVRIVINTPNPPLTAHRYLRR
jgi:hypothetical protein